MLSKKYRICVNEDTLPLITFLNDGVVPTASPDLMKKDLWFLFEITAEREITVGRNSVQAEDDLYDTDGTSKDEFIDYHTLIG